MAIVAAFAVPHPPLAIAGVGRGQEQEILKTLQSYRKIAHRIADLHPDVLLISSPHATCYYDYLHISPGNRADGDFGSFGDPDDEISVVYDTELVRTIAAEAIADGLPCGTEGEQSSDLDHATMVPLSFIQAAGCTCPVVRMGIAGFSYAEHYRIGQCVARACQKLGRRAVYVASGDLSHRLTPDGPYGFNPAGPEFDAAVCEAFATADFARLLELDRHMCDEAGECGLRSFLMMAGALDGQKVIPELLSYEGPFGVGYAVASFTPGAEDETRHFGAQFEKKEQARMAALRAQEDPFVSLARASLESWVRTHQRLQVPKNLPEELYATRAGAFCSIHKDAELRGCIGTILPTETSLADEIIQNAISAGTRDPRFSPVTPDELPFLVYSVDVLSEPEHVDGPDELDPQRYGVIVSTADGRRGLLLPDLEGIDTVEKQISIAARKGNIRRDDDMTLERFEVIRHH